MRRTSAGNRAATHPSTKNVARTPDSSKSASSRSVFAQTRLSNWSQVVAVDDPIERADLKVVLDIDAHGVDDRAPSDDACGAGHQAPRLRTTVLMVSKMMKKSRLSEKFLM